MRYGSVCSGIEAATVAWHSLGWEPQWFAEIEKFPSRVLATRWPGVRNIGDFTQEQPLEPIDLLVGGTPCQDFSVAGLRAGLAGARGGLTLDFLRLAHRLRARWVVWENVPGVLSSGGGRDFGAFLGGLAELGYGWAYRVLDAQHFGVAQRRRRVFVVGCLGSQPAAAAVLFERACLRGDSPPSRKAGEEVACTIGASAGRRGGHDGNERGPYVPATAGTFTSEGFDASEDGTGRGPQLVATAEGGLDFTLSASGGKHGNNQMPLVVDEVQVTSKTNRSNPKRGDPAPTISKESRPITFNITPEGGQGADSRATAIDQAGALTTEDAKGADRGVRIVDGGVRRLTPREYERLFGFPDDYTKLDEDTADGPRYRALGNSMAVPVMAWLGKRIQMVEEACERAKRS